MITQGSRLVETQSRAGLLSSKIMRQKQTIKQWWPEIRILLSELMTLRHALCTREKQLICEPSLTMQGQEISPAQPGGGADDGSVMSTQERQSSSSPPPNFCLDIKLWPSRFLGHCTPSSTPL